jgi:hypothetical protein
MRSLIILFCVLSLSPFVPGQQNSSVISGCLLGNPGTFMLGAVPSGDMYRLRGNAALVDAHRDQLVRLTGTLAAPARGNTPGVFTVQRVDPIASSCTTPLSPQNPNAISSVTGKAGMEEIAANASTTRSAGRVTPGNQTEAGEAQQLGVYSGVKPGERNQPASRGRLAPPLWDQVGQDQPTADLSAAAAQRAEEQPNETLGVNALPSYANPKLPEGAPATQGSTGNLGARTKPPLRRQPIPEPKLVQ